MSYRHSCVSYRHRINRINQLSLFGDESMQNISEEWGKIVLDLTSNLSSKDRFDRLLLSIRQVLNCDASALLSFNNQQFTPLAISGLYDEVLGRRFNIQDHPRLEAIARAGDIVRFPSDSELPDPYDGLIANMDGNLNVHSCVGLPLMVDERLIGALTIDGFSAKQFDGFSDGDLRIIAALAATSLNTSLLMEQLERQLTYLPPSDSNITFRDSNSVEMIGHSSAMNELNGNINVVSNTDLTVLISGETGVGKELVAGLVHANSARRERDIVYLNCAALPESVAESELFGHVKGAFTGAISHRKGKFELADGGTLFLDEIGELSIGLQAKLLRALQYGDIQRVGDDSSVKVDVRIIAATNRILHDDVKQGRFRADLYHRLTVFPILVPALRDRQQDITLLAGHFAEKCKLKLEVRSISLSKELLIKLNDYHWPGNVRELEHMINRAAVIAKSETSDAHLVLQPYHFSFKESREDLLKTEEAREMSHELSEQTLKSATDTFQRQIIEQCYSKNRHNWSATARELGIDSGNLHRLAKRLGVK